MALCVVYNAIIQLFIIHVHIMEIKGFDERNTNNNISYPDNLVQGT